MSQQWTLQQVEALSPDTANLKRGKALANTRKWQLMAQKENALWGLCKGSGSNPYKTQIDLTEPAFKCSCPSRKFPCKHGLGLMILYVNQATFKQEKTMPDWVEEWLGKRVESKEKKAKKAAEGKKPKTDKQLQAKAKREEKTMKQIHEGLEDMENWLLDTIRLGTAELSQESFHYFEQKAKRLVDAKAKGASNAIEQLYTTMQDPQWQEKSLEQIGQLYILSKAFREMGKLSPQLQEDVKSKIGINVKKEVVLSNDILTHDTWYVLGKQNEVEDELKIQRTWLLGQKNQQYALILDFAYGHASIPLQFMPGTYFDANFAFFPGFPYRAVLKNRTSEAKQFNDLQGFDNLSDFLTYYANVLAENPFINFYPCLLNNVIPVLKKDTFFLIDTEKNKIEVTKPFSKTWEMLAMSGGHPMTVFGTWGNHTFTPFSVGNESGWSRL